MRGGRCGNRNHGRRLQRRRRVPRRRDRARGDDDAARLLHEKTAQLPAVDLSVPHGAFGRNTEQAILQGVYHGIRGMVKELVENYATELGPLAGPDRDRRRRPKLFEGWELIHAISPDLTLYGIALAYVNHHIKHGA